MKASDADLSAAEDAPHIIHLRSHESVMTGDLEACMYA